MRSGSCLRSHWHRGLFTSKHWYYSNLELEPDKYCDVGDLLFAWSASFGPFIWPGPKAIYHYHIWKLNLHSAPDLNKDYLYTFLLKKTQEIKAAGHGVSMLHMTKEKMEKIVVPVPPLAEQARIVARVEELMQLCDALESHGRLQDEQHARLVATLFNALAASESADALAENWQRIATHFDLLLDRPEAVDMLEQTLLQLAVRGLLVPQDPSDEPASVLLRRILAEKHRLTTEGKINRDKSLAVIDGEKLLFKVPKGWEWTAFGTIAEIERGGSPRPIQSFLTNDPNGLNWIKIGDTDKGGKYITSTSQKIRREGLSKTRMVFPGDFLLTNSMSFGRPYITQIEGCIHDGWLRISPPSCLNKDYLFSLLSSQFIRKLFVAAAAGGVVMNLNADKVRNVPIPLLPLAEQSRIVARVEQLRSLCADLRGRLQQARATQSQLADALVARYSDAPTMH